MAGGKPMSHPDMLTSQEAFYVNTIGNALMSYL